MSACVVGRAGCAVPGWLVTTMDMSVLLLALPRIRAALNPLATEAVVDRRRRRVRGRIGRRGSHPKGRPAHRRQGRSGGGRRHPRPVNANENRPTQHP